MITFHGDILIKTKWKTDYRFPRGRITSLLYRQGEPQSFARLDTPIPHGPDYWHIPETHYWNLHRMNLNRWLKESF